MSIVISFIGLSNVSYAADVNKIVDDESKKNPEVKPFDNYTEIITYIEAYVYGFKIKGFGVLYHVEMWGVDCTIDMNGCRVPLFPLGESNFCVSSNHVLAPHFMGIWWQVSVDTYSIKGVAIGNIEWE